jgi:hypothetical protein
MTRFGCARIFEVLAHLLTALFWLGTLSLAAGLMRRSQLQAGGQTASVT